jgi:hypothetical protein
MKRFEGESCQEDAEEKNQCLSIHHQINALTQGTVVLLRIGALHISSFDTANHFDSEAVYNLHLTNHFRDLTPSSATTPMEQPELRE